MNNFDVINWNMNVQPIPSIFNEGYSQYETLSKLIYQINVYIENMNLAKTEIDDLNEKKLAILDYMDDIKTKRKLDENGNFTGTWNGLAMSQTSEGLSAIVDSHTEKLSKLSQFKLIADIPTTDYVAGDSVDYSYLRNKQELAYGDFYRKLLTGSAVKICCMGDSMTNGQDTSSGDVRQVTADITRNLSESMSSQTIASITYPESLQANLRSVFGSQVSVLNRGYSGDWVKGGYEHYPTKHDSNLTIVMYGTNDSRASWVPDDIRGDITDYINWYEQLIIREILWDKAVVILTPPKLQTASDVNIKTFANILKMIGEKYGVPVVDSTLFTANYPSTIYSDSVHFNGSGYKVFASKVTAFLLAGSQVNRINDGDTLLTRPNIDGITYYGGATFVPSGGAVETPAEINTTTGIVASWTGTNKGVVYSFYVDENDLMIIPYYYSANKNVQLTLDFNITPPHNNVDELVGSASGTLNETPVRQVLYTINNISPKLADFIKPTGDSTQPTLLRIIEKGWHTLKIETTDDTSVTVINAIHFMSYENYKQSRNIQLNATTLYGYSYMTTGGNISSSATLVLASASSTNQTYTLPSALTCPAGKIITVARNDSSANTLTVQTYGTETLYGTGTISGQYSSKRFVNNGTGWLALA